MILSKFVYEVSLLIQLYIYQVSLLIQLYLKFCYHMSDLSQTNESLIGLSLMEYSGQKISKKKFKNIEKAHKPKVHKSRSCAFYLNFKIY